MSSQQPLVLKGVKVVQLIPGQIIEGNTYIGQFRHPIWPHLQCVVWKLRDGTWSHDALSPGQEVGWVDLPRSIDLTGNLRRAMLGSGA